MPSLDNVIKGISVCVGQDQFRCKECPYDGVYGCRAQVMKDALVFLKKLDPKQQEPRVMTLDELTEIYVEFKGNDCPIRLNNFDLQKIIMYAVDGVCRIWTGKPTDEQRQAVKWE